MFEVANCELRVKLVNIRRNVEVQDNIRDWGTTGI